MPHRKLLRPLALAAALTFGAAACGGGQTGGGGGETGGGGGGRVDGTLKLGYVLPETGQLAFLGPPQIQAVKYARSQINEAGGVLGKPIPEVVSGDEAGKEQVAIESAQRVVNSNVDALIGAAASGMSSAILDTVTGAGVVQCSGSNTSGVFTTVEDNGYYFRTAPNDALHQGPVLANTVISDGHTEIAVVGRADDYGKGLVDSTTKALEEAGATVALQATYDPNAPNFDAVVRKIAESEPDAAVIIAFDEGIQILQGMIEAGVGPQDIGVYGADGLAKEDLATRVSEDNPGVLAGMKGTAPGVDNSEFFSNLQEYAPDLESTQFAAQVYDCVTLVALGAEAAGTDDPAKIKEEIVGLTKDGEKCESFADCKALLEEGTDIDYDGASGPLEFSDVGEPTVATYRVYAFNEEGEFEVLDYVQSQQAS